MEHAIAEAARLGLTTYLGFIFAHNTRSLALFLRFGFQQWGHLPRVAVLDGIERDLLIMGRRVDT
jgi:phosphinothricin acetyltransferase